MTLKLDYNDALCFKDNLTVLVEAFIRHITGTIKPEMLEEEERPVDVEVRRHEES